MTRRRILLGLALACALPARPAFAQAFDPSYAAWDALLKKHVRWLPDGKQSRVDYAGLARDRPALQSVLAGLSAVPRAEFDRWSAPERMAFLVNAYNAFTVELILTRYPDLKSPELFHTMMAANPDYLLASYAAVDEAFGSFDGYLTEGLGMTAQAKEDLRALLLE